MIELNKIYNNLTPYHIEPDIVLLHGDCVELLPLLKANSCSLFCTDPPYSVGTTSTGNKGDWLDNSIIKPFFKIIIQEIYRLLNEKGEFYINTDWRTYPFLYPIIQEKMPIKNLIVWDYEWIKAGSHYRFSHEFIIYGLKHSGVKRQFSASERDVFRIAPVNFTIKKHHQAEKPIELISKIIQNSTNEGDLIIDPFVGSGTTAVAAKALNRKFIGIDISEKNLDIAKQRLSQEVLFKT